MCYLFHLKNNYKKIVFEIVQGVYLKIKYLKVFINSCEVEYDVPDAISIEGYKIVNSMYPCIVVDNLEINENDQIRVEIQFEKVSYNDFSYILGDIYKKDEVVLEQENSDIQDELILKEEKNLRCF